MRNHRARMGVAVICLAIVAMLAAACGTSSSSTVRTTSASQKVSGTVVVFAAASLKDAFDEIGKQFEQANPGVSVKFNYAGSSSPGDADQAGRRPPTCSPRPTPRHGHGDQRRPGGRHPKTVRQEPLEIMVGAGQPEAHHVRGRPRQLRRQGRRVRLGRSLRHVRPGDLQEGRRHRQPGERGDQRELGGHQGHARRGGRRGRLHDRRQGGRDKAAGRHHPGEPERDRRVPDRALKDAPNSDGATAFIDYVLELGRAEGAGRASASCRRGSRRVAVGQAFNPVVVGLAAIAALFFILPLTGLVIRAPWS